MVGITTMTIIAAHALTRVMLGGMAVVSRGIVATVCLPEAMMEKTLGVLRGRLTAPTARRQTGVAHASANSVELRCSLKSARTVARPCRAAASFAASAARRANQSEFSTAKTFVKGSLRGEKTCLGLRLLPHV